MLLFVVPAAADMVATAIAMARSGHAMGEANPIYLLTGNVAVFFGVIVLLQAIVAGFIYWYSSKLNPINRFVLLMAMLWASLTRLVAVVSAIKAIMNPVPIEIAQASPILTSAAAKAGYYYVLVIGSYLLPLGISWVGIYIFSRYFLFIKKVIKADGKRYEFSWER